MEQETIERILDAFEEYRRSRAREPSLFSVLCRDYDEDLLSRLILRCLCDDASAVTTMLETYDNAKHTEGIGKEGIVIDEGRCEQIAEGLSRIDLFIRGHNAQGEVFSLAIENKTRSWEHGSQTQKYERWVKRNALEDEFVYFIFLKPSWNKSPHSSKAFVTITYSQLAEMFTVDNRFIYELTHHIRDHLEANVTMNPTIFRHSKDILEIANELVKKRNELGKEINDAVHRAFLPVTLKEDHSASGGVWRYCAQDLHWWDEKYKYYFYIEFKIGEDGDFSNICVQRTLKIYPKNNADKLNAFMHELNQNTRYKSEPCYNRFWIHAWPIVLEGNPFSPEWVSSLKEEVLGKMKVAFEEQDVIVKMFREKEKL